MNLQTFYDDFDLLAEAPNGVQKLRELILQLAVEGLLVPQNPNDEPASFLLKRIDAEKERLIKEKKIRKADTLLPIDSDQKAFELPDSWEWVRLDSICHQITDGAHHTPTYTATGIPFLSVKDISGGKIDLRRTRFISSEEHNELIKRCKPEFEDILLTKIGTTGIAKVVDVQIDFSIFVSLALLKFSKELIFPYFLELALNSPLLKDQSSKNTQGVGNKNLVLKFIKNFVLPLPPIEEQRRIVAKVDQLMKLCDELEARQQKKCEARVRLNQSALDHLLASSMPEEFNAHWQRICNNFNLLYDTPESISKLRQSILQLAVRGKLVSQNPNDVPASELLEKIKAERESSKENVKNKKVSFPAINSTDEPFELQQGWLWVRLGQLAKLIEYGTSEKASLDNKGIPILRMNNINNGKIDYKDLKYVPTTIKDLPRLYLKHNELLFNRTNSIELVGKTGIFKGENETHTFASYLIRVRVFEESILPDFVCLAMNASYYRDTQINPEVTQQCGQANFNGTKLANTLIPLPPLEEQKRIVAKVGQLMKLCDELEANLTQAQNLSENLMASVVNHLFATQENQSASAALST